MKKIMLSLAMIIIAITVFTQTPQAFKYQAIARNNLGDPIINQLVSIRVSLLEGSVSGTAIYTETHEPTTNKFGLFRLEIGFGTVVTGNFANIPWGDNIYFLQMEMDENGGNNYQWLGTSQLLSVPYALYSETSGDAGATEINDLNDGKTGGSSVFLGGVAGQYDDGTNNSNVGVGNGSLRFNTSGHRNVAVGNNASGYNTTGFYNTVYGTYANQWNIEGSRNTILGYKAGWYGVSHNKSGNVFIGYQAGIWDTTDNKLIIENSDSDAPLIWGDFENDLVRINGDFEITGSLAGDIDIGIDGLSDGKTGGNSVFLGTGAGANNNGSNTQNVGIGDSAMYSNTSGFRNTVAGYKALFTNTGGYYNTAIGQASMYFSTTGTGNTAVGHLSSSYNSTGSYNVAIGERSNYGNSTGSYNTIIGAYTGFATNSKSGNVFLGYKAGYWSSGDNKLFIDNSDTTKPLIYGEFDNDIVAINGKLGIGTTNPFSMLSVGGSGITNYSIYGTSWTGGVFGNASGHTGRGVYGHASNTGDDTNYGGYFKADGLSGRGVYGNASNTGDDANYGGYFKADGQSGRGVYGNASNTGDVTNYGGYFYAAGENGRGVYGYAPGSDARGVYGYAPGSDARGVFGEVSGIYGVGVSGISTYTGGTQFLIEQAGGFFKSMAISGCGVYAQGTGSYSYGVIANGNYINFFAEGPGMVIAVPEASQWQKNVAKIDFPIEKISKITGIFFDWDDEHGGGHDVGVIPEEVGKVFPEAVVFEANGIDVNAIDYTKLTPLLVEVAKAQQQLIEELTRRVEELEKR